MELGCDRIVELVPKVVDRQALEWEVEAVSSHTAGCADCAQLQADLRDIGRLVREPVLAETAAADFSGFWRAVEAGIDREERLVGRATAANAPARSAGGWAWFSRFAAAAAVAAMLVVGVTGPSGGSHYEADNRIEVSSIEGGADNTVMIYESPEDNVTFIWVIPDEEQT